MKRAFVKQNILPKILLYFFEQNGVQGFFDGESNCYAWVGYQHYSTSVRRDLDLGIVSKALLFT
jgi:hypothetical protein